MKNALVKHTLEYNQKNQADGKYALNYTTCPEKSVVVKPDEGEINYAEFKDKNAHQFVEKVINGKVEKIEIIEQAAPSSTQKPRKSR